MSDRRPRKKVRYSREGRSTVAVHYPKYGIFEEPNIILYRGISYVFPDEFFTGMRRFLNIQPGLLNNRLDIDYVTRTNNSMIELEFRDGPRDYLFYCHVGDRYIFMYKQVSRGELTNFFILTEPFNLENLETFIF